MVMAIRQRFSNGARLNIFNLQETSRPAIPGYEEEFLTFDAWRGFCSVAGCGLHKHPSARHKNCHLQDSGLSHSAALYQGRGVPFGSTLWVYIRVQKQRQMRGPEP